MQRAGAQQNTCTIASYSWVCNIVFVNIVGWLNVDSVLTLVIPAAFFAGIRNNVAHVASEEAAGTFASVIHDPVSDTIRDQLLRLSRGLAVLLLIG